MQRPHAKSVTGIELAAVRRAYGISRAQLARELHVSESRIRNVEIEAFPPETVVARYRAGLAVLTSAV